jgi:two-component system sensor histidine kinase VicK
MNKAYLAAGLAAVVIIAWLIIAALFRRKQPAAAGAAPKEDIETDFILDTIEDGVVMVASDGIIHLFNPAAGKITGWNPAEAVSLNYKAVLPLMDAKGQPLPDANHPFALAMATGKSSRSSDAQLATKNNKLLPISLIVSPVIDSAGQPNGSVVGVFRDIAKEREQEAQRSDFISTASHEMRTPLAAIEGYIALALNPKTAQIDANAKNYLEKASTSTLHLGQLFQDLLTSSKAEDGRLISYPAVLEIGEMLEQVAEASKFHAKTKGLELKYTVSAGDRSTGGKVIRPLYYAYVDPNRIREVFQNIIENAIKYTMSGEVMVRLTGDVNIIQIQVQDTGGGIPAEDISHLFQKFYRVDNSTTRSVGGTGLGLFICKKIVELYNGHIWVESEFGKGSTFFINLPRLSAEQALQIQQKQASTISPMQRPL